VDVGDRVRVGGGYDQRPEWLTASPDGYEGTVVAFIPGHNDPPAAVIALDEELVLPSGAGAVSGSAVRGRYLVLELGHVGTDWTTPTPRVHVELCDAQPEDLPSAERRHGAWVESHATYWPS